ncbi:DUF6281 family protein [Streptomyces sp. NPDC051963]|uniref:DUF6281 family protein n=1 Tax=Streptomyces sp. NPDC051963 TaxID=3365678 RepID=UPI0037D4788B
MTTALRIGRRLLVTAVLLASAVGCSTGTGSSGDASCAYLVQYGDREYLGTGSGDFAVGERLGTATIPVCNDTGDDEDAVPARRTTAYSVQGTDPTEVIAVGDTPGEAILATVR